MVDGEMWHLCGGVLYAERRIVVPKKKIMDIIIWHHDALGHPGIKGTVWELHRRYRFPIENKELAKMVEDWVKSCQVCAFIKPNSVADRGIIGCLPLPAVYLDFVEVDKFMNFDYIMVATCGLSNFTQAWPCTKKITSEGAMKLFFNNWIMIYGAPIEVHQKSG